MPKISLQKFIYGMALGGIFLAFFGIFFLSSAEKTLVREKVLGEAEAVGEGHLVCMPTGNIYNSNKIKVTNNTGKEVQIIWQYTLCPLSEWTNPPGTCAKNLSGFHPETLAAGAERILEMNVPCGNYGQLDVWQNPDSMTRQSDAECFNTDRSKFWDAAYGGGPAIAYAFFKGEECQIPTPTPTPTNSPTPTATGTPTQTPTPTCTPTGTLTPTPTPTPTETPTPTPTEEQGNSYCVELSANPESGTRPLAVRFDGEGYDSRGAVKKYRFHFDDGTSAMETDSSETDHVYRDAGDYYPWLEVLDRGDHWRTRTECTTHVHINEREQVLGNEAPPVLPKTGFSIAGLVLLGIAGAALKVLPLIF